MRRPRIAWARVLRHNPLRSAVQNPPSTVSLLWGGAMLTPLYPPDAFPITRIMAEVAPVWVWGPTLITLALLARWPPRGAGRVAVGVGNAGLCLIWWYVLALAWGGHPVSPAWPFYLVAGASAFDQGMIVTLTAWAGRRGRP